jgi:hypothetical protein
MPLKATIYLLINKNRGAQIGNLLSVNLCNLQYNQKINVKSNVVCTFIAANKGCDSVPLSLHQCRAVHQFVHNALIPDNHFFF